MTHEDERREVKVDMPKEIKLNMSYEDYMRLAILWVTMDTKDLAKALYVVKVAAKGSYIMGLFGGEKKSGSERYAGLVVSDLKPVNDGLYLRLYNTDKEYLVPSDLMRRHGIDIYKVYYLGTINPFKCSALNVILSSMGEKQLKEFIEEVIRINKEAMTEADERRLRKLSKEVKARINVLRGSHYVVYRGNRVFTACVPEDLSKSVSAFNTGYIECRNAKQAYYYAAILNYMAYKVISEGREFMRDHYARPSLAIVAAKLTWKDLPSELRDEIARLSHELSRKLTWIDYPNQKKALLETAKTPEFAKIIELLDKHIESAGKQRMLEGALGLVSVVSRKEFLKRLRRGS
ncbi:MAG: hypothetical protein N3F67_05045 [Acidilobaceae archaeon]|nr:hypothetical protein [Acidilobaceae archaeon]